MSYWYLKHKLQNDSLITQTLLHESVTYYDDYDNSQLQITIA